MGSDLVDREDGRAVVWESDQCAYDDDDQLQARGFNAGRFTGYVYL